MDVILRLHARYPLPNFLLIKWYAVSTIKTTPNPDVKIAVAIIHLLLPWTAASGPVSAGVTGKKLEIKTQFNVVIKQMSEFWVMLDTPSQYMHYCLRPTVWGLLCYCVRDNDHCCVFYDVTRDLLFAWYIVHQPNAYPSTES